MRIAVFSDIHGNGVAFDAMLADLRAQNVDGMLCLGDAIQGGPQPAQVVQRLRELACPVVMGNADAWLLSGHSTGDEGISEQRLRIMEDVRQWSLGQLSGADRDFIAAFQPTVTCEMDGLKLLGYHGSPRSFDDVILPDIAADQLADLLRDHAADLNCGGHTHVQFVRRFDTGARVHFNPGSVGLAYSHQQPEDSFWADPWAEYAVLDCAVSRTWSLEFRRVPFDVVALIQVFRDSQRPHAEVATAQYAAR